MGADAACGMLTTCHVQAAGKFGHQIICINVVAPFLVPFNQFVGGPYSEYEWDVEKTSPHSPLVTMGTLFKWLPPQQKKVSKIWPLDPRTVLSRWEQGEETHCGGETR